ncbi:TetR family transcriptional regulator [Herbiconiux sp. VKM Ac-1786]|uniref:TetR/AcrR family transcriptional regulator n=1 Tax=Herbiconiux sp. VKM Ac-1786 TaxID=2783824 RepID=UPI00188CDC8E|nr:TetR/AcrR family transcriptional regulator [Herbiconiux sp. VKM Ac-1786]MBF4571905.1 TetR family transcriptional regulator [Herbiconiux sp. VKM Ac-1786]
MVDGLRERKRAATQETIERAAIALALEHGFENVTVDMICEASMVSQRTFFNYFGSKEGVILGGAPPLPGDEQVRTFTHEGGSNLLADFLTMITSSLLEREPDAALFQDRRTLIMRTPELLMRETARMSESEDQFVAIILTRFEIQGRVAADQPELEEEARMVVALTTGVLQYVRRRWVDSPAGASTRDLLRTSIELIHSITNDPAHNPKGTEHR